MRKITMKVGTEIQIYLDKYITEDLTISNEGISVYCVLRGMLRQEQSDYVITANQLLHLATNKITYSKHDKIYFLRGLNELIGKEIIEMRHVFNISEKLINLSPIVISKENSKKFTTIQLLEIQTILNSCGTNRYSVLRYFILLIGTFNPNITVHLSELDMKSRIISTMPIDYLCKLTGLSKSTILTYNKILEDLKLLYIYHAADYYHTDENAIRSPPNIYGRYCDKTYIDKYVQNEAQYRGYAKYVPNSKTTANHKRCLAQRYNQIVAGSTKYSIEEIKEVYDYIVAQNKEYQSQYEKSKWDPFKEKIRDIGILETILQNANNT